MTVPTQQRGYPPAKTISGDGEVGVIITHSPRTVRRGSDLLTDALSSEVGVSSCITQNDYDPQCPKVRIQFDVSLIYPTELESRKKLSALCSRERQMKSHKIIPLC